MTAAAIEEGQEQGRQQEHPVYHDYYLSDIDITRQKMPVILRIVDGCSRCRKLLIQQETEDCK